MEDNPLYIPPLAFSLLAYLLTPSTQLVLHSHSLLHPLTQHSNYRQTPLHLSTSFPPLPFTLSHSSLTLLSTHPYTMLNPPPFSIHQPYTQPSAPSPLLVDNLAKSAEDYLDDYRLVEHPAIGSSSTPSRRL